MSSLGGPRCSSVWRGMHQGGVHMAPHWFEIVAWAALGLGFASALVIAADIVLLGNRQHMAIMNLVFPLTALYMGPLALWLYLVRGRRMSHKQMQARPMVEHEARDSWWQVSRASCSTIGRACICLWDIRRCRRGRWWSTKRAIPGGRCRSPTPTA